MAYNSDGTKTALFLDLSLQNPDNNGTALTLIRSTAEPSLSLVKDVNTIPNGIAMNPTGLAYDNGTTITSTSWDDLSTRIAQLSAVAPNGLNATILAVNNTVFIENADTAPTRVINIMAGDTSLPSEHFGILWEGDTLPFVMETLDATPLEVRDTTFQLNDTITPLLTTMTASGITTGVQSATWANIIAGGGGVPSIDQVLFVGQNANNQPITNLNGIGIAGGTNLYNNSLAFVGSAGAITDLSTINGANYPPTTTADLTNILTNGDNAGGLNITNLNNIDLQSINQSAYPPLITADLTNILTNGDNAGGLSMTNVSNINLSTINGSPYPFAPFAPYGLTDTLTYSNNASNLSMTNINNIDLTTINGASYPPPSATQDLSTTLAFGNSAGSTPINMNSNDIQLCNDITLVSINSVPFLPAKFSAVFPTFNVGSVSNNSTSYGGTGVIIPVGNYQITYTIQLDGNITQGGGSYFMVRGYCFIYGASFGIVNPFIVNNGYMPTQTISYAVGSGYYNCLTTTDYITISNNDTFQLGVYQSNEQGQTSSNTFISAVIQSV